MKLSIGTRNYAVYQPIQNLGTCNIYTGSAPSTADLDPTGTLLWTGIVNNVGWANPINGTMSFQSYPLTANAIATGTAGYCRFNDTANTYRLDLSVGLSGAECTLSSLDLVSGQSTGITSLAITLPSE